MASRFDQQKPDPAIGQNIRRARAGKKPGKDLRGLIVAASLSATLGAWGLFAHQDAQALADAQAAATTSVEATAAQDTTSVSSSSVAVAPTAVPTLVPTTTQAQATPTTTTSTQQSTVAQAPVARTRSSR